MSSAGRPGLGQRVSGRPLLPERVQGRVSAVALDGVAALELGPVRGIEVDGRVRPRCCQFARLADVQPGVHELSERHAAPAIDELGVLPVHRCRRAGQDVSGADFSEPAARGRDDGAAGVGGELGEYAAGIGGQRPQGHDHVGPDPGLLLDERGDGPAAVGRPAEQVHAAVDQQHPAALGQRLPGQRRRVGVPLRVRDLAGAGDRGPVERRLAGQHTDLLVSGQGPVDRPDPAVDLLVDRAIQDDVRGLGGIAPDQTQAGVVDGLVAENELVESVLVERVPELDDDVVGRPVQPGIAEHRQQQVVDLLARMRVADGNHPVSLERRQDRLGEAAAACGGGRLGIRGSEPGCCGCHAGRGGQGSAPVRPWHVECIHAALLVCFRER